MGEPEHPNGVGRQVRASLPELDDGTYVITWRVTSVDSHPIRGAFTFSVGAANASSREASGLAQRLLTDQGGSTVVGAGMALARMGVFLGVTVLIGAAAFLAVVWRAGRAGSDDGDASTATFSLPAGLAFDAQGALLVADMGNRKIRRITLS